MRGIIQTTLFLTNCQLNRVFEEMETSRCKLSSVISDQDYFPTETQKEAPSVKRGRCKGFSVYEVFGAYSRLMCGVICILSIRSILWLGEKSIISLLKGFQL